MLFCFKQSQLHAVKNEFARKQSQMGMRQSLATEWRAKAAHSKTWVSMHKQIKPRMGRKKFTLLIFCRPCRGLKFFGDQTHGFTVGCFLPRLRRWGRPVLNPTRMAGKSSSRSAAQSTAAGFGKIHAQKMNSHGRGVKWERSGFSNASNLASSVRSDIFVETRTNKISSPVGAAYSGNGCAEDVAPDGA